MKTLEFSRLTFGIGLGLLVLAGCGGAQGGGPGAMAQSGASVERPARGKSWVLRGSSGGDLVYISSSANAVYVYSYPDGTLVGTLTGFNNPAGLCSDAKGNVWITNSYGGNIVEYAHGGTSPIATLQDSGQTPEDCAVDPTTGNLAVADLYSNAAIYTNAQGSPAYYSTVGLLQDALYATYDNVGDLFLASKWHTPVELRHGSSSFQKFGLKPHIHSRHAGLQFDGTYVTLIGTSIVYRYSYRHVPGGKQAGTIKLNAPCCADYWIQGSELAGVDGGNNAYFFSYPAGGDPVTAITGLQRTQGVTISVAPSGSHIRK